MAESVVQMREERGRYLEALRVVESVRDALTWHGLTTYTDSLDSIDSLLEERVKHLGGLIHYYSDESPLTQPHPNDAHR